MIIDFHLSDCTLIFSQSQIVVDTNRSLLGILLQNTTISIENRVDHIERMSEELDIIRLRAKRAGNKSAVTKLANEVQEILQKPSDKLDTKTRHRLQCIDSKLSQKETLLNERLTTPATKFATSETITPSSGQSGQAIPSTSSGASPSSAHVENQEISLPSLDVSPVGFSQGMLPINPVVQNQPTVQAKLPKLTLPRFHGEITHWITFWDSYKSAVHNNPALSKVAKFNYLNSLLEGAAKRSIQGLTLSDANNDSAVEILEQCF